MSGDRLILAVDAGNSRIKWALHDGRAFVHEGRRSLSDAAGLGDDWQELPAPALVVAGNVAGQAAAATISNAARRWSADVRFLTAKTQQCGVKNLYSDPAQLGIDRWAALVAARARGDSAQLVICAGTAVTVDALLADGSFIGGVILPGFRAMHSALAATTAGLSAEEGEFRPFPRGTRDAISSGAIQALCGAVERMHSALAAQAGTEPAIVACGGSAELIARHLQRPVQVCQRLVLEGLIRLAGATP
jgi:type III pantothenate kinase